MPISAYILTKNNADTLEAALQSVTSLADEIVAVDSGSDDGTLDILRRYTDRVIEREWPGFRDQYQFAAEQCAHDWVLFIDADEAISPTLAQSIKDELAANPQRPAADQFRGYDVHRRTFYLGRWILHGGWLPDHEIRLYDRRHGSWQGGLHAKVHVDGPVGTLRGFYYHFTYRDLSDQLRTIDRYSDTAADDLLAAGRRWSLARLLFSPPLRFLRDYLLKRGFLDGLPGLIIAVNTMFYGFVKYAKLWERQHLDAEVIERARADTPD